MRPLVRAIIAAVTGLAAVGPPGFVAAAEDDAYYPAGAAQAAPAWERPRFTRFSAQHCGATIDKLTLNRDSASEQAGSATYTDGGKASQPGAGGWALTGDRLKVSGDGFVLEGRWVGPVLTAVITRTGGEPLRCRFEVATLRSFTQYQ